MKIGIDGRALQGLSQGGKTGVGRYTYELCRKLDKAFPHAMFYIYSAVPIEMPVSSPRWVLRLDESPIAKFLKPVLWLRYLCGRLCKADGLDVFWGAATFLPRLPQSIRTVITVYDLNFLIVPDTMNYTHKWGYKLFFKRTVRNADVVLSISKGSSNRLYSLIGRAADHIVYPAVDLSFKPQSDTRINTILSQYRLKRPYILSVATWEPRKNLELLLRTFLKLKQQGEISKHTLVLVGGRGWKYSRMAKYIEGNNFIIPIGYVPGDQLPALYSGADLFVFPSIYEGFGMPVLEAIACGTKVVASDIPELREAGGEDAIYITPTMDGLYSGILKALSKENTKEKGNKTRLPSWDSSAAILASALSTSK